MRPQNCAAEIDSFLRRPDFLDHAACVCPACLSFEERVRSEMADNERGHRDGPRFRTLDKDDARRGREETTINLRREKRAEQLQKKRFGPTAQQQVMAGPSVMSIGSQAWQEANPPALVEGVHSEDPNLQLPAVTQFRKLLSIERSPPIEEVIAAGVVPRFVQFLQVHPRPRTLPGCGDA